MSIELLSCDTCGSSFPEGARFCSNCGKEIDTTEINSKVLSGISKQTPKTSDTLMRKQHFVLSRKLEYYRNRLLKIDATNRSILLRGIRDLWCFDLATISTDKKIIDRALSDRKPICIIPNSDRSQQADNQRTRLRKFYQNTTQIHRETGRQENYLGFPFLVGHVTKDLYIRGPLILFPISIIYKEESRPAGWYIVFSEDKDPILNRALLESIRVETYRVLSHSFTNEFENLLDKMEEQRDELELSFLNGLFSILDEHGLIIDTKHETANIEALDKISVSQGRVSKDNKQTWIENEPLHLKNHKIIGVFPQGENAIYSDYEELIKKTGESGQDDFGIIEKLLPEDQTTISTSEMDDHGTDYDKDVHSVNIRLDDFPADRLNFAIASDSSQDAVVLASQSSDSDCIVVRGPPGTGKSQVIVNLISNALANNQKVLLICEKRDALDVVYQRLDKVGLSRYVAPLFDGKDRSSLYKKLSDILDTKTSSRSVTVINQEFNHYSREIDRIIEQQRKIAHALKDESLIGVSVTKIYAMARPGYTSKLNLTDVVQEVKYHRLPHLLDIIGRLKDGCKKFDLAPSPWVYRKDFSNFGLREKNNLTIRIDRLLDLLRDKSIVLTESTSSQQTLIDSLETLSAPSHKGLFRKIVSGGKEHTARENAKRYVKEGYALDDINKIKELLDGAKIGLQFWDSLDNFFQFFTTEGIEQIKKELLEYPLDSINSRLNRLKEYLKDFDELVAHDRRKTELSLREREILDLCLHKIPDEADWKETLRQEFYTHWIEFIESKYPDLRGQPFETYQFNREQLSKFITKHRKVVVDKILNQIDQSIIRPDVALKTNPSYKTRYDKWNILLDELNRKRHVLPIKKLFERHEGIMLRIAPCWLATPSAVSSIFPLKRNIFDYIIFDEASQSRVAQSLAALYRGKKIVIIGDEKQLPPVFHFSREDEEEIRNDEIDRELLSESLLELANRMFNHTYLRWHYRSIHQELVDFSNHAFYDELLKIAPNISKPSTPPIRWISCNNGRWIDRSNRPEAELVVNELKKILIDNKRTGGNRSVGIITFNTPQKEEIWDEIERRKRKDSEFKELYAETDDQEKRAIRDLPFVRNIENVQGEERDIIIFSLGYAKDLLSTKETFGIHFGSLNGLNGENYLNVAITRARQEIIIVCSLDPDKINIDNATHTGPRRLKEYLCYAKSISKSNHQETMSILSSLRINQSNNTAFLYEEDGHDELEALVKTELEKLGYRVNLHVGNSNYKIDIAVVHPDNPSMYILAIECDGNSFQSAESTKERDITRLEFLESKGWTVERIWSRNWWKDSNKETMRIRDKIEELRMIRLPTSFVAHPTEAILEAKVSGTPAVDQETILNRIKKRESSDIELKSSFRYDIRNRKPNPKMEKIIAKTVSAFMNAEGGTLYIGVDDENNVIGLQEDYQTLKKQNSDGFEIEFRQAIEKYTKNKVANEYLKIRFHPVGNKEICEVVIAPSSRPVFVYDEGKQECFVRVGNSSKPYDLDEFYEYSKRRFK